MSAPLPVIPRPPRQRVRDFQIRFLPILVVAVIIGIVAVLWNRDWAPTAFVGEVQSPSSTVLSPELGRLLDLGMGVEQFETVTNGQVLARVALKSDEALRAGLAALRADLHVLRLRMLQDQERNDLNRVQVRTELLLQRAELASARVRLRQAESEFERTRQLYEEKVLPAGVGQDQGSYEVALRDRDALRVEVEEKTRLVEELAESLRTLHPEGQPTPASAVHDTIETALRAQEKSLEESEGPRVLRAPINGMIMRIYRRPGEIVTQGEPLFEIRGVQPEWIIGFVRQPISAAPKVEDSVEVRSRGRPRQIGIARVTRVGGHLELFSQPLRVRGFDASQERGLPVLLSYPSNLKLHPGELVDLVPRS